MPPSVSVLLLDETNDLFVSSVSVWEIASKHQLGKLPLAVEPKEWISKITADIDAGALPFTAAHALMVSSLAPVHRDPFDRMLICQAKVEGLTILTADEAIRQYDVPILW